MSAKSKMSEWARKIGAMFEVGGFDKDLRGIQLKFEWGGGCLDR